MHKPRSKTKTVRIHGVTYTIDRIRNSWGLLWFAESASYPWWVNAPSRKALIHKLWYWAPKQPKAPALAQTR